MPFPASEVHDEFHEFSLEGSWCEGVRIVTAFLTKLPSPATLWVWDAFAPWLHCIVWQYKTALKSTK